MTVPPPSAGTRLPLNVFGIAFGLTGLAGAWTEATRSLGSPQPIAEALWELAIAVWLGTVAVYLGRVRKLRDIGADLTHPVLGPFAALIPIPPMLLGAHLFPSLPTLGTAVVALCATLTAVFGFWFLSQLLTVPRGFDTVHSGYFLPTVAGGLLTGQSLAVIGQKELAVGAVGVGLLFWVLIGGAVIARVIAGPPVLGALLPTLGIFSAPPAVAGNAWWVISEGRGGTATELLAGAMVAVIAPHFFLIRRYSKLPFALGFWALTFTAAASATFSLRLLSLHNGVWATASAWIILALATAFVGAIGIRSLGLLRRH